MLDTLLQDALAVHVFSGYQLVAGRGGERVERHGGVTAYWDGHAPVTPETWFDIGSVTKAVVTTSLAALALERGEIALSDRVEDRLPELAGTRLAGITIRDLLVHEAGLRAWSPLFRETTRERLLEWFVSRGEAQIEASPGSRCTYSDVGFLLLGLVLERALGHGLGDSFRSRVAGPLGLGEVGYRLPRGATVAATEYCRWRGRVLCGEVFDENAAGLGGENAHAGLFATARGLVPWCHEWLKALRGESSWLGAETARAFIRRSGRVPGSTRALGWDTRSEVGSSAGERLSPRTFGHLGYPGCSVWIDPDNDAFVIFLTNRIHPSRVDERIRRIRPAVHDAVAALWRIPA